jgi:HEAT repeat protein
VRTTLQRWFRPPLLYVGVGFVTILAFLIWRSYFRILPLRIQSKDTTGIILAADTLKHMSPERQKKELPGLLKALESSDLRTQETAIWLISLLSEPAIREALPSLLRDLESSHGGGSRYLIIRKFQEYRIVEAIPTLIRCLDDDRHSGWAVRGMGSDAVPALREALHDPNPTVRKNAVNFLSYAPDGLLHVREALKDPDPRARSAALIVFSREIADKEVISLLVPLLTDPDVTVRSQSFQALKLAQYAPLPNWFLFHLQDEDLGMKQKALESLSAATPKTKTEARKDMTPGLLHMMTNEDPEWRLLATTKLGELNIPEGIPLLFGSLEDSDPRVREKALVSLSAFQSDPIRSKVLTLYKTLPKGHDLRRMIVQVFNWPTGWPLTEALADPDPQIQVVGLNRWALCWASGPLPASSDPSDGDDEDTFGRGLHVVNEEDCVGTPGLWTRDGLRRLEPFLKDEEELVREAAVNVLGQCGTWVEDDVEKALHDSDEIMRLSAATVFLLYREQTLVDVIPVVIALTKSTEPSVRRGALSLLKHACHSPQGRRTAEAQLALQQGLQDADLETRRTALLALMETQEYFPAMNVVLEEALADKREDVRCAVLRASAQFLTRPKATDILVNALKDQALSVRETAQTLLSSQTRERQAAIATLVSQRDAHHLTSDLAPYLGDKDPKVRLAAVEGLIRRHVNQQDTPGTRWALWRVLWKGDPAMKALAWPVIQREFHNVAQRAGDIVWTRAGRFWSILLFSVKTILKILGLLTALFLTISPWVTENILNISFLKTWETGNKYVLFRGLVSVFGLGLVGIILVMGFGLFEQRITFLRYFFYYW